MSITVFGPSIIVLIQLFFPTLKTIFCLRKKSDVSPPCVRRHGRKTMIKIYVLSLLLFVSQLFSDYVVQIFPFKVTAMRRRF